MGGWNNGGRVSERRERRDIGGSVKRRKRVRRMEQRQGEEEGRKVGGMEGGREGRREGGREGGRERRGREVGERGRNLL